jgi:hypothetical protein
LPVSLHSFGGAATRVAPEATAFGTRDPHQLVEIIAVWTDARKSPTQRQRAQDVATNHRPSAKADRA